MMKPGRTKPAYFRSIIVRRSSLDRSRGVMLAGGRQIPCALGRRGITNSKHEGDGATPSGRYLLVMALYRPDREILRPTGLPVHKITRKSGWCDAPDDRNYNRKVSLPYHSSHEELYREDRLYDWLLVLDQNYHNKIRGRGSAIFLHMAKDDFRPTEGCIAIKPNDMRWIIGQIGLTTELIILSG